MSDDEVYKSRDPRLKKRENQPGPPGRIVKDSLNTLSLKWD